MKSTKGPIKSAKIEVIVDKATKSEWLEASRSVQQCLNNSWRLWSSYHALNETDNDIRRILNETRDWAERKDQAKKEKRKFDEPKPKWTARDFPETDWEFSHEKAPYNGKQSNPDLHNDIYHYNTSRIDGLAPNIIGLINNKWRGLVTSRKSSRGNLKGWMAILLGLESIPTYNRPQPIPFQKKNAKLIVTDEGKVALEVKVRVDENGKTIVDKFELMLQKRKCRAYRKIIEHLACETEGYQFKGSQLVYDKGKWFVSISYELPTADVVELDAKRVLRIVPGETHPFIFQKVWADDEFPVMRNVASLVGRARSRIQNERFDRWHSNRHGSENRKGRGRDRAMRASTKLKNAWNNQVSNVNRECANYAVSKCLKDRVAVIEYAKPVNDKGLCLAEVGADDNSRTSWQWFQLESKLKNAASKHGITVKCVSHPNDLAKEDND